MAIVASTGDVALAAGATTEAGGPFPGAEDFAVGSVTVTPVGRPRRRTWLMVVADVAFSGGGRAFSGGGHGFSGGGHSFSGGGGRGGSHGGGRR